jgi:hypothetical protein
MKVEFLDAARAEYRQAVDYYDGEQSGLGGEFADEVARTTARIVAFPEAWQKLSRRTRRCRTEVDPENWTAGTGADKPETNRTTCPKNDVSIVPR